MKIKSLKLKNFHRFNDVEIEFDSKITRLCGVNGSGKTSVLNAIWAAMKGISEKSGKGQLIGERFRFIGSNGVNTELNLTLIDESKGVEIKVRNKITKTGNEIAFLAPDDYPVSNEWLSNLLSITFMSAKSFGLLSGQEQAISLGIDVSTYDKKIKAYKEEFTGLNRDLKNLGIPETIEKVERVSVADLVEEQNKIVEFNNKQKDSASSMSASKRLVDRLTSDVEELKRELAECELKLKTAKKQHSELTEPEELKDDSEVKLKIQNVEKINYQAEQYEANLKTIAKIEAKKEEIENNKKLQEKEEEEKVNYIKSFEFGFDGLTVNDDGELLLNDGRGARPIKEPYYSKGQLEIIVAKLHASLNPEFKVRWIDDFNLLDEMNQGVIVDQLLEAGFQIITSEIASSKVGKENCVLLKDCAVVESYEEKPKNSLL
jgi:DNA repair exonuclease SbcCD ATPase subunit